LARILKWLRHPDVNQSSIRRATSWIALCAKQSATALYLNQWFGDFPTILYIRLRPRYRST